MAEARDRALKRESLESVNAELSFMVSTGERPYVDTEALTGASEPRYHAKLEQREVPIHDARPRIDELSLDRQGVKFLRRPTCVEQFYDEAEVERAYYPEIEALVKEITGANHVIIFDHTRRRDDGGTGSAKAPARRVHNDYTELSAPQRVRDLLGKAEAEGLSNVPFVQINVWRPIVGPVKRSPLALLDASTLDPADLIGTDMVYPDRIGEIYHLAYNPGQRWLYFPVMEQEEAIAIKGFDSRKDGRARFSPHTAFDHPTTNPNDPPRESIEVRTLAFFT